MSKSVKRKPEEKKIHKVGKDHPDRKLNQELKRINSLEDLEHIDLDEVFDNLYTTQTKN